jgi:uncharacterized membrane protein (UPF0182 family)
MDSLNEITDAIQDYANSDVKYNMLTLRQSVDNITYIVGMILGLIVWGLTILIILVTVVDLLYLTIPIVRSKIDMSGLADRKKMGKFRVVSYDATKAIEQAALNHEVSPLKDYLRIRAKTNIFVACLLTILLSGLWQKIQDFLEGIISTIITLVLFKQ